MVVLPGDDVYEATIALFKVNAEYWPQLRTGRVVATAADGSRFVVPWSHELTRPLLPLRPS